MKCLIIYFSVTGNTKKIACAICSGIKKFGEECEIAKLKDVDVNNLSRYDLIGLGSPIHFQSFEPIIVTNFIKRLNGLEGKHFFIFSTHATEPEGFVPSMREALHPKRVIVIGAGDWYGGLIDQQLPHPYLTDGHPDEIDLKEAEIFGQQMLVRSRRIAAGENSLIPHLPIGRDTGKKILARVEKMCVDQSKLFPPGCDLEHFRKSQSFKNRARFNISKCLYPECRLCVENCPMGGIDLTISPPRFANPCISCLLCERICPTGAIEAEFGEMCEIMSWRTRYVYAPVLAKAEAEGRFRRLIPLDKVGWNTPYYKVHNSHPRYVIT